MRPFLRLLPLLLLARAAWAETQTLSVKTLPGQMRYDVTELTLQPGADVKLTFQNQDQMPHNMVFFQPGTDAVAVCNQQMEKPDEALKRNYLPEDPRIWMHSKLLNPGEKEELVFKAPSTPGVYPFACSMPGHAMIMQGRLKVFAPGPRLSDLQFHLYLGDWKKLPDFSTLQPHRAGPIPDNLVELNLDDYKNQFGVVYEGKLKTPRQGEYSFALACDDGARVLIDGKKVVEYDGIHSSAQIKEGKIKLAEGEHAFRLEYFQAAGYADIFVAWRGPDFAMTPLSKWLPKGWERGASKGEDENAGLPLVVAQEPIVYRNFITGAGDRGIGVGYPGQMNIAWSAESLNLALIWRGAFIDAARHWHGRGGGFQPPMGYDVVSPAGEPAPPLAYLSSPDATWPRLGKGERAEGFHWKGYSLDARRYPTFSYEWEGINVSDSFDVEGDAVAGGGKLIRNLKLSGSFTDETYFLAASGHLQPVEGGFLLNGPVTIKVAADGAILTGNQLLLPARPNLQITYSWAAPAK